MTLTIDLKPEVERLLRAVARERGVELEDIVAERLGLAERLDFSEEELEELEDELDVAEAKRRLANNDPSERKTLDDLRRAWNL
jgi:hypothetical protein